MTRQNETIRTLIQTLEAAAADLGGDTPVRIAFQPSWPLAAEVAALTPVETEDGETTVLWIAATSSAPYDESPYAPSAAWEGF